MLILQNIAYAHPNKDLLFDNINLKINRHDKIALIGNNGIGKSTLLKILAGALLPSAGSYKIDFDSYYIPQHFGQYNDHTIARALQVDEKLFALRSILNGDVSELNFTTLNDDWGIEERSREALSDWKLDGLDLSLKMNTLSGGQKTKVFLAGIAIHQPQVVLMDEPGNHLDMFSRTILYEYIQSTSCTLIIVSHDRTLLNLLNSVCELSKHGITVYGGNYDFYAAQKEIDATAFAEDLKNKEKALRRAKEVERDSIERQQKLDVRGKKKQEKAGMPTIVMNTLRNNAEKSTSRIKDVHAEKVNAILQEVNQKRRELPDKDKIKIVFDDSSLHNGKILLSAKDINYSYGRSPLWERSLDLEITSGSRFAIKGINGSGKTTLIKIFLGVLAPTSGIIERADIYAIYIDQDYSLIHNSLTVFEQARQFNTEGLQDHEIKSRLTHFLFTKDHWDKQCIALSGGEKMRLILCCLTITGKAPDMIVLDEPTNNLDIRNTEILTAAVAEYRGTIIVVSHDAYFLEQINVESTIELK